MCHCSIFRFLLPTFMIPYVAGFMIFCNHSPDMVSPDTDTPTIRIPAAPEINDPAFSVSGLRAWYLIGDSLTHGHDSISISVQTGESVDRIDLFIDSLWIGMLRRHNDTLFNTEISLDSIGAGQHTLLLSADNAQIAFVRMRFNRSAPMYVTVSNDWENPVSEDFDSNLVLARILHQRHPDLVITYFVGPYFFTDPRVPEERRQWIASFLREMRDEYGDEIGLHIHPWCSLVQTAGITCKTDGSFNDGAPDTTGYAISCLRYSEAEFTTLLRTTDSIFLHYELDKPTSFRAGAWMCGPPMLGALAATGFTVDASGCNIGRLDELAGSMMVDLLTPLWPNSSDTSQPYYPSVNSGAAFTPSALPILEVPDNGTLADYVTGAEMIDIFNRNRSRSALSKPRMCSIGYHVDNLNAFSDRIERALAHIDYYLASSDLGPVVFARMSDCTKVWRRP